MPLAAMLLGLIGPAVGRVLVALGFSVVTMSGVELAFGQLKSYLINSVNTLPGEIMQLFLMAGGGVALNMIFGAITFRLSVWAMTNAVKVVGRKG